MRIIIYLLILLIPCWTNAQKIKKDMQAAKTEITSTGKTIYVVDGNPNSFYYKRYDDIGETIVMYVCENNQVRKVLFVCEDPTHPAKRALEAFKTVNSDYEVDAILPGVFKGTNSSYYQGKARYEGVANYRDKKFYLEIILLD